MASLSSGLNPNDIKTGLDDVFNQEYNVDAQHPNYATAETPSVFHQDTAKSSAVIWELFQGVGQWETRAEEQDVPQGTPRIGNTKTFTVTAFAKQVKIPKHLFDDDMHSVYEKMVRNFALRARTTRDSNAFAVFRGAFGTTTTADAVALLSDSHTALNGSTVDNLLTGALSETTLNTAIIQLVEMKGQDGVIGGAMPDTLLVPISVFKLACEITESELRSATPDNDLNVYSTKYGIKVGTSQWLGAAAGGDDDAWFLMGTTHSIYRFVRKGIETDLVSYQYTDNNTYIYKGEFREVVGAMNFEGIVGSAGA